MDRVVFVIAATATHPVGYFQQPLCTHLRTMWTMWCLPPSPLQDIPMASSSSLLANMTIPTAIPRTKPLKSFQIPILRSQFTSVSPGIRFVFLEPNCPCCIGCHRCDVESVWCVVIEQTKATVDTRHKSEMARKKVQTVAE